MTRLNFIAFVLFVFFSIALAVLAFSFGGVDFNVYYAAARVTLQGGNPYDYQQLAPQIISTAEKLNNPYYYAPWFTWSLLPLALLPYTMARIVWAVINLILWFWALFNLSRLVDYPHPGWTRWGICLLVTFVFAWATWGAEQVGILILFLFTLILLFVRRENWIAAGIFMALILFKPNITAIPVGMLALWLLFRRGMWKSLWVMVGTFTALVIFSLLLSPQWYLALFQADKLQGLSYTLNESGGLEIVRYTTTLKDWLAVYGVQGGLSAVVQGVAILIGIVVTLLALRYASSELEVTAIAILASFAVIPYALFYDYPSLTLPLFYGNFMLLKSPSLKWMRYAVNAFIPMTLFIGDKIPYRYWITVILVIMFGVVYSIEALKAKSTLRD